MPMNQACVALANKMARRCWATLYYGRTYEEYKLHVRDLEEE